MECIGEVLVIEPDKELELEPEVLDGCRSGQQLPVTGAVAGLRLCELPTEES